MQNLLHFLASMKDTFIALGPLGGLLIALIDSFIPLPGGSDFAVITLSAMNPALAPVAVMATTIGSVTGSTLVYLGARRVGVAALSRFSEERRARVENLLGRYDLPVLAVAALLPPPFPFKIFNLTAGVLRIRVWRFVGAILLGRVVRFSLEALLAVKFGDEAMTIIRTHGIKVLGIVALAALGAWTYRYMMMRRATAAED